MKRIDVDKAIHIVVAYMNKIVTKMRDLHHYSYYPCNDLT